jgi:hypothetical protein
VQGGAVVVLNRESFLDEKLDGWRDLVNAADLGEAPAVRGGEKTGPNLTPGVGRFRAGRKPAKLASARFLKNGLAGDKVMAYSIDRDAEPPLGQDDQLVKALPARSAAAPGSIDGDPKEIVSFLSTDAGSSVRGAAESPWIAGRSH